MDISFDLRTDYVQVTVSGEFSFPQFLALIDRTREEAERNNCTRILIDAKRMIGEPDTIERFYLGEKVAAALTQPFKTLLLAEQSKINKFGEDVAVNRGALLLATWDNDTGMAWLLNKDLCVPKR